MRAPSARHVTDQPPLLQPPEPPTPTALPSDRRQGGSVLLCPPPQADHSGVSQTLLSNPLGGTRHTQP